MSSKKSSRGREKETLDLKALGRRIRELRGFDLNQRTFAAKLGISQSELSKFERGTRRPTLELVLRLKAEFGKSVGWLLTGKDP
jgi:transcriptional regulator with XRE-family HTH domain